MVENATRIDVEIDIVSTSTFRHTKSTLKLRRCFDVKISTSKQVDVPMLIQRRKIDVETTSLSQGQFELHFEPFSTLSDDVKILTFAHWSGLTGAFKNNCLVVKQQRKETLKQYIEVYYSLSRIFISALFCDIF